MKKYILLAIMISGCLLGFTATAQMQSHAVTKATTASAGDVIKRGAPLGESPALTVNKIMSDPQAHLGKKLMVEGKIERVCPNRGCWMELVDKSGETRMRITFKDYAFFVPTDSKGMNVKAEGELTAKKLDKAEVEHLTSEGAQIKTNADGTANIYSFVANGVELYK